MPVSISADGSCIRLETEDLVIDVTDIVEHRMENAVVTVKEKAVVEDE